MTEVNGGRGGLFVPGGVRLLQVGLWLVALLVTHIQLKTGGVLGKPMLLQACQDPHRVVAAAAAGRPTLMLLWKSVLLVVGSLMSCALREMPASMLLPLLLPSSTANHFLRTVQAQRQGAVHGRASSGEAAVTLGFLSGSGETLTRY